MRCASSLPIALSFRLHRKPAHKAAHRATPARQYASLFARATIATLGWTPRANIVLSHAPRPRAWWKLSASLMAAISTVALRTPMPGIDVGPSITLFCLARDTNSAFNATIVSSSIRHLPLNSMTKLRIHGDGISSAAATSSSKAHSKSTLPAANTAPLKQNRTELIDQRRSLRNQS